MHVKVKLILKNVRHMNVGVDVIKAVKLITLSKQILKKFGDVEGLPL